MRKSSFSAAGMLAAVAVLGSAGAAPAATTTTSVTLTGGSLQFATAPQADAFAATTLTGQAQTVRTTFHDWVVSDARGSGAGWNVTMQASALSDGAGHSWPGGSLKLTAPTGVLPVGVNLAVPPILQAATFTLDGASPVKVLSAAAATGAGDWSATQANLLGGDLVLTIPADAIAGTYSTTITSTLATGP
jgi:WxL domain surface cell wall-binding